MNVARKPEQVPYFRNNPGLETILEQRPYPAKLFIDGLHIGYPKRSENFFGHIFLVNGYEKMVVIWHQAVSEDFDFLYEKILTHQAQEVIPVFWMIENRLLANTAVEQVIETPRLQ